MTTRARRTAGGYRLRGAKSWITNAPIADLFLVWAKTEDDVIRGFLIERGADGLSAPKIEGKFSLRASATGQILMDDVFVPERATGRRRLARAVCLPDQGPLRHRVRRARRRRVLLARGAAVRPRSQAVRPSARGQSADPEKLADMQTEIAIALQAALRLGRLMDEGKAPTELVSCASATAAARRSRSPARRATCTAATASPTSTT